MGNANYTVDLSDNTIFNISVPYDSTGIVTGWISASFSPASSISAVELYNVDIANEADSTRWTIGTDQGSFPIRLLNDSTGSSQIIYVSATYNNINNATQIIDNDLGFRFQLSTAELSAGTSDTLISPASNIYWASAALVGSLTAAGGSIIYDTTPRIDLNISASYGASSSYLLGYFSLTSSSTEGDNTSVTAVNYDIYISGVDVSKFASVSAPVSLPNTITLGDTITFNTRFNNTYLHSSTEYFTVVAVVSTTHPVLSGGWYGSYTPSTTQYATSAMIVTALGDQRAPSGISGLSIENSIEACLLSWTNPIDTDLSGVYIQRSITSAPTSQSEGVRVGSVIAPTNSYQDVISGGRQYYYSIFSFDNVGKVNTDIVSAIGLPEANIYNLPWAIGKTYIDMQGILVDEGII